MSDTSIEKFSFGKKNTLYKESIFKRKGIFSGINFKDINEARQERNLLIQNFEETLSLGNNGYEETFLKGFFYRDGEQMSLYHQLIEWNLEVKEQGGDASLLIEQFSIPSIREKIQISLSKVKASFSSGELQERKKTLLLQIEMMKREQNQREKELRERSEQSRIKRLEEIGEQKAQETNPKKLRNLENSQKELEKPREKNDEIISGIDSWIMQLFQEKLFLNEIHILIGKLPENIGKEIVDQTPEISKNIERKILEEIRESYIKTNESELLSKGESGKERSKKQIISLQFLLSKLGYYQALQRERNKGKGSVIFHFLENHNNPVVKKSFANYLDPKKRRDGERVSGVLDTETILALTYFQYQNLGKDTKNADGIIGPKTMEVILRDLKVRKI